MLKRLRKPGVAGDPLRPTSTGGDHLFVSHQRGAQWVVDGNDEHVVVGCQLRGESLRLVISTVEITDQHHQVIVRATAQCSRQGIVQRDFPGRGRC
jgi:hypothetical protein